MISLHSNAPPNPIDTSINGADAFFISNNLRVSRSYFGNYTSVNYSAYFAERIIENIDTLGIRRGNAFGTNLFILRETNVPAVLVENGFHTNPEDRAKLLCDDFLEKLADVYFETIIGYFANITEVPNYRPAMPRIFERVLEMLDTH
jgi:N-acetylmuramoyl-L-alanine amidase